MNEKHTLELDAKRFDEIMLQGFEDGVEVAFESLQKFKDSVWGTLKTDNDKYLFEMRVLEVKLHILGYSQLPIINMVNIMQEINKMENFDIERLQINMGIGLNYIKKRCVGNE